jgi:hypothetical protein
MPRLRPACEQSYEPLPHSFVPWDADPRFQVCQYGCGRVLGPGGVWGPPLEALEAAPQSLFGEDELPPLKEESHHEKSRAL